MAVGCTKYRLYTGNQQLLAVAKLRHLHLYSSKERRLEYWSETEIKRLTMSEEHIDLPYVKDQGSSTLQLTGTTTLSREPWKAQDNSERSKPAPPSAWTLFISMVAVIMCPLLGCMAFIFAVQGKQKYNHGEYFESEALCSRARGTAYYAIAVGIGIALFLALVLGLGPMFNWY